MGTRCGHPSRGPVSDRERVTVVSAGSAPPGEGHRPIAICDFRLRNPETADEIAFAMSLGSV